MGVGEGVGVGVGVCDTKNMELQECGEKSRSELQEFESPRGGCSSRLASTKPVISHPVVSRVDPLESRETRNGAFTEESLHARHG